MVTTTPPISPSSHLSLLQDVVRGETYLRLRPDRVAMQDATAQVRTASFLSLTVPLQFPAKRSVCKRLLHMLANTKYVKHYTWDDGLVVIVFHEENSG